MEDALALMPVKKNEAANVSLNPCFNGRCTRTFVIYKVCTEEQTSLNPCFNGRCTRTLCKTTKKPKSKVLILVLMEDALARALVDSLYKAKLPS